MSCFDDFLIICFQIPVDEVIPMLRTFRSELRGNAGADFRDLDEAYPVEDGSSYTSSVMLPAGGATASTTTASRVIQLSKASTLASDRRSEESVLPMTSDSFQSLTVSSVPSPIKSHVNILPRVANITSISVMSSSKEDYDTVDIPGIDSLDKSKAETVQSVVTATTSSMIPPGQVRYVSAVMNPQTGRKLSLEEAVKSGLMDLKSGQFIDQRTGRKIPLSEAARLGFIDKSLVKELSQKCGIQDPRTGREMSLLEAMQKGYFDPVVGDVIDPETGKHLSLQEAVSSGVITPETANKLSYVNVSTSSTTRARGHFGVSSMEDVDRKLSLTDAIQKGLYDPITGKLTDPISKKELTLGDAIKQGLIDPNIKEIIHPVTGEKLSVQEAIAQGILDRNTGEFKDLRTGRTMPLDQAQQRQLIAQPINLHSALVEGILDADGKLKDVHTGKKLTLQEAIEKGILDTDCKCIVDPRSNEVLSIAEAMQRGLIDTKGRFIDPTSGQSMSIQDAVNQGLTKILGQELSFSEKGIRDTILEEKLTVAEAIARGFIDPSTGMYVDKGTGRKMSIQQAQQQGLIDPHLAQQLQADSGLHDIVGNNISVLQAINKGLLDVSNGKVTDPATGRTLSIGDAAKSGYLTPDKAKDLLQLTSPLLTTTTVTTKIRSSQDPQRDEDMAPISVQDAVQRGLIDEDTGTFTDPVTNERMPLEEAINIGRLRLTTQWPDKMPTYEDSGNREIQVRGAEPKRSEEKMHFEESDEFTRDIVGGKELVSTSKVQDIRVGSLKAGPVQAKMEESKTTAVSQTTATTGAEQIPCGMSLNAAIACGALNNKTGLFHDRVSGNKMSLEEAIKRGFINPDSAVVKNPQNNEDVNLREAIELGLLQPTGHFTNPKTGKRYNLEAALNMGAITTKSVPEPRTPQVPTISENRKMVIKKIVDPLTGNELDCEEAIAKGVLNAERGIYRNPISGEEMSIYEAINRDYIKADIFDENTAEGLIATKPIRESRSFTITGAVDPMTGQKIDVAKAVQKGIIDQANGQYVGRDAMGQEVRMSISEAIQRGLVVAEVDSKKTEASGEAPQYVKETKTLTIKGVVDPVSGENIPVSEAIRQGILDQSKGLYVNPRTGDSMLITDAVQKGLISADVSSSSKTTSDAEAEEIISSRNTTCMAKSVIHPVTGVEIPVSRAVEEGILDQGKGLYVNPLTGHKMTLSDAIDKGLVLVEVGQKKPPQKRKEIESIHIDDLQDAMEEMASEEIMEETKKFSITSVVNPLNNESITFDEALNAGIIDEGNGVYQNPITGESMPITQALNKGLIVGLLMSAKEYEVYKSSLTASKSDEFKNLTGVIDPFTGAVISLDQAVKLGLINKEGKTFYSPITDETMSIEEAIKKGFILTDEDSNMESDNLDIKTSTEDETDAYAMERVEKSPERDSDTITMTISSSQLVNQTNKPLVISDDSTSTTPSTLTLTLPVQQPSKLSLSFDNAVKLGLFNTRTGKCRDPQTGEIMSLEDAIKRGLIDPAAPAISDLESGQIFTLNECFGKNLIVSGTGKINDATVRNMNLTLDPLLTGRTQSLSPINFEDAVLTGMFDTKSGLFRHPKTGETMTLRDAISKELIDGKSTLIMDPNSGKKVTLAEALNSGIIDQKTGDFLDVQTGEILLSLADAMDSGLVESKYKVNTGEVTEADSGVKIQLKDAIQQDSIHGNQLQVYDPYTGKRINKDEAIRKGLFDEKTGEYVDKKTGKRHSVKEAAKLGLLAVVGAPVLAGMAIAEGVKRVIDSKTVTTSTHVMKQDIVVDPSLIARSPSAEKRSPPPLSSGIKAKRRVGEPEMSEIEPLEPEITDILDDSPYQTLDKLKKKTYIKEELQKPQLPSPATTEYHNVPETIPKEDLSSIDSLRLHQVSEKRTRTPDRISPTKVKMQYPSPATTEYHTFPETDSAESGISPIDGLSFQSLTGTTTTPERLSPEKVTTTKSSLSVPLTGKYHSEDDTGFETMDTTHPIDKYQQPKRSTEVTRIESLAHPRAVPESSHIIKESQMLITRHEKQPDVDRIMWETGQVIDPNTGEKVSVNEALHRKLIDEDTAEMVMRVSEADVDWDTGVITDSVTGETLSIEQALEKGLIDHHIAHLIRTRMHQSGSVQGQITLNDAVTQGLLIVPLGRIKHPVTGVRMTIEEAIDKGFLNPDQSVIVNPANGEMLTLTEAIRNGIFDPHSGDMKNTSTGKTMTLTEVSLEGLIPECNIQRVDSITVKDAMDQGLVNSKTGMYSHPPTGETMSVNKALSMGYIIASETETTLTVSEKQISPVRGIALDEAVKRGLVDTHSGTFRDPNTSEILSLAAAIQYGYILAPQQPALPEQKHDEVEGIQFEEALRRGLIDVKNNTFTDQITGVLLPLNTAIEKGYLILPPGDTTVTVTRQNKEVRKATTVEVDSSKKLLSFAECLQRGYIDLTNNAFTDPKTGKKMPLDEAVQIGLIDTTAEVTSSQSNAGLGMTLAESIDCGMFDDDTGIFTDLRTGEKMSLQDAIHRGYINKDSLIYDVDTRKALTLQEALDSGRIDPRTGKYVDPSTGGKLSVKDAAVMGLIAFVGSVTNVEVQSQTIMPTQKKTKILYTEQTESSILQFTKVNEYTSSVEQTPQGLSLIDAISSGQLDPVTGRFVDPHSGQSLSLQQAIQKGLIDPNSIQYRDPNSNQIMNIQEAMSRNLVDDFGRCSDPSNPIKRYAIREALNRGLLVESKVRSSPKSKRTLIKETTKLAVTKVTDPRTGKAISMFEAVEQGIVNTETGQFINPSTGESMSICTAYEQGLISGRVLDSVKTREEVVRGGETAPVVITSDLPANVTAVVDPKTKRTLSVAEAVERGILDESTGRYITITGETLSLMEAVSQGLVITSETISATRSAYKMTVEGESRSTKTVNIKEVIDPRTGRHLTLIEAIQAGLFDQATGHFIHPLTGQIFSLDKAMQEGFVIVSEPQVHDDEEIILKEIRAQSSTPATPERQTFSIKSVLNAQTNQYVHPADAVDLGALDLNRGVYINTVTGETMPIHEAYQKGFVNAEKADSSDKSPIAAASAVIEMKSFTITAVMDTRRNEQVPVQEAINRGILDQDLCTYLNLVTGKMICQSVVDIEI